jgi:hypothetical protein
MPAALIFFELFDLGLIFAFAQFFLDRLLPAR